jgi:uncharacterized protein (TIGR03086 family)
MDTTITTTRYRELAERLATVADDVEPSRWDDPSPCEGWSAADVISHLVETQRDFLAQHGFDLGPAPDVHDDPARAWRVHAERVTAVLARPGAADTTFDGFFGPTTVGDTIARFYGFDMIVHRWDIARAAGLDTTFADDELDQVERSIDGFGEHLYMDGICERPVDVDPSASRQDRLLARMGRDPA